ncbi:general stress protein [Sporosarcina sp. P33]|uniref:general stress protein n=1 Tax=Sporosarcina sp. P33 TaxID=1930764 RepID=UPI0009BE4B58|nr:general stress protein [Sporosarcina sp. P33]
MRKRHVVGTYDTDREAIAAIKDLKRQGFTADEISIISKNSDEAEYVVEQTDTHAADGAATGAAAGGLLGGIGGVLTGLGALAIPGIGPVIAAGPIVAGITGAAAGAGAGGLAGALIGMGIPDEDAHHYHEHFEQGKILVLLDSDLYDPAAHTHHTAGTPLRHSHTETEASPLIDPNPLAKDRSYDPLTDPKPRDEDSPM